jgi:hypothetical protein
MEFEFNFGEKTLAQGIKKNEAIYASVLGVALPLSHEELVFMDRESGENHVMTQPVLQALSLCQNFKPIDQHVRTISQNIPELANQVGAIEQVTSFLINKDLLIEDKAWQESLCEVSQQFSTKSAGIVIRISQQPKQLKRQLQSLVKYQNKFKSNFSIQIYDDSLSDKLEEQFESICREFKKELNITFFNKTWQKQFIKMLTNEFPNKTEIIKWLLEKNNNQYSGGRVWNFALLNNAGKKFLFFDDDYIFESRVIGKTSQKISMQDKKELNVGFSLSLSEIRDASVECDKDILTSMINTCGQTVGNWLSTSEIEFLPLENLNLLELQRVNSLSVIKTIGNGSWGSPRTDSNFWLYFLEGKQKQEFWKTRETYLDNIEASNLMHYSDNYEFLSLTRFVPSAIDNSSMMPFAVPFSQSEDYFFNAVTLFCYPNQVSLHYPVMMGHIQAQNKNRLSANYIARTPNFNKFLADYALTLIQSTDAQNPQLRLKTLSHYVMGLADSCDQNILNRLKEYLSQIRSDMVLTMQQQLAQSPDAPVYWQADVRELIEANGKALLQGNAPILGDWDKKFTEQNCIDTARNELVNFANAMQLWPDIWEFCKTSQ